MAVDLPQPDGPMIAVNDPEGQLRDISLSASMVFPRPLKVLQTPWNVIPPEGILDLLKQRGIEHVAAAIYANLAKGSQAGFDVIFSH